MPVKSAEATARHALEAVLRHIPSGRFVRAGAVAYADAVDIRRALATILGRWETINALAETPDRDDRPRASVVVGHVRLMMEKGVDDIALRPNPAYQWCGRVDHWLRCLAALAFGGERRSSDWYARAYRCLGALVDLANEARGIYDPPEVCRQCRRLSDECDGRHDRAAA